MLKNIGFCAVFLTLLLAYGWRGNPQECPKEPYKQNEMVNGCVMQKSGGTWIRTCG